jgi:hypothetical protein
MSDSKIYTNFDVSDFLVVGDKAIYRQILKTTNISIASSGSSTQSVTNFFNPGNSIKECGNLNVIAFSSTLASAQHAKFNYTITTNSNSSIKVGDLSPGFGLAKTNGNDITIARNANNLDVTIKLTSGGASTTDAVLYVFKSNYFNIPNYKIAKNSSLVTRTTNLTYNTIQMQGWYASQTNSFSTGSSANFDFTSFFNDANIEIGELHTKAIGGGISRKYWVNSYVNYNTNRAISDTYGYSSAEDGSAGGSVPVINVTGGNTLRMNVDFTDGTGSGTGTIHLGKNILYQL